MDIEMLKSFFMWCTILNGGMFVLWALFFRFAPDLVYRTQKGWSPLSRESFELVHYGFLGMFKIVYLVFSVVPFVALLIIR